MSDRNEPVPRSIPIHGDISTIKVVRARVKDDPECQDHYVTKIILFREEVVPWCDEEDEGRTIELATFELTLFTPNSPALKDEVEG